MRTSKIETQKLKTENCENKSFNWSLVKHPFLFHDNINHRYTEKNKGVCNMHLHHIKLSGACLVRSSALKRRSTMRSSSRSSPMVFNSRSFFFGANPRVRPFSAATDKEDGPKMEMIPGMEASDVNAKREALPVTFADIFRANVAIRGGIKRTTCEKSYFLSELIGANIFLKTEFRQFTGSFKERGARNAILHHLREQGESLKSTGVIAASAGNHALALAYHGMQLGTPVTVVMPTVAPLSKVDKCRVRYALWHLFSFLQVAY